MNIFNIFIKLPINHSQVLQITFLTMGFLLNNCLVPDPSDLNSGHFRPWYKYTVWKKIPLVDKKDKTKVEFDTHYTTIIFP